MTNTENIKKANKLAKRSLILAGLFIVIGPFGSIPAIIYGRSALKGYKLAGITKGTGMAKAGFWIGWIGLILVILHTIVILIIYFYPDQKIPVESMESITPIQKN